MLLEISVKNFAIMEDVSVRFEPGLNVLTGETGAGKSILVGAIGLVMGDRASSEMIRAESEMAEVQALFDLSDAGDVAAVLNEQQIEAEGELIIRRVLNKSGVNRIYLNGSLAPANVLKRIGECLVNVYGQHESQGLLRPETHIGILDAYGGLIETRAALAEKFAQCKSAQRRLDLLEKQDKDRVQRMEFLQFQIHEIEQATVRVGEMEELSAQKMRLKGADQLATAVSEILSGGYEAEGSILEQADNLRNMVERVLPFDPELKAVFDQLGQISIAAEEIGRFSRSYLSEIEHDPRALETLEDRFHLLKGLMKKYGADESEVLSHLEKAKAELDDIENLTGRIEQARKEFEKAAGELIQAARRLSEQRKEAAKKMAEEIGAELSELAMKGSRFSAEFRANEAGGLQVEDTYVDESGMDRVEFLLSANPGEPERPLAKIASGGELSRILLAVKNALARHFRVPTLVFDEVDAGIGGRQAEIVGKKLLAVSSIHQVLCITHLPQIASKADHHFKVEKSVKKGRTVTTVSKLDDAQRLYETARMLSGDKISDATKAAAREMIVNR